VDRQHAASELARLGRLLFGGHSQVTRDHVDSFRRRAQLESEL
jgi:hypothetical protein